jgi:hypothetical protein
VLVLIKVPSSKAGLVRREDNEITAKTAEDHIAAAQRVPVPVFVTTGDDHAGNVGLFSIVPAGQKRTPSTGLRCADGTVTRTNFILTSKAEELNKQTTKGATNHENKTD